MLDQALWGSWLSLARTDAYQDAFDLIGFSYYFAASVDATGAILPYPSDQPLGPQGYVPWPDGIRLVLNRLAEELPGRRFLVAELGYGGTDDHQRTAYLHAGLDHIRTAITDGIDIAGVFFWTGIDNYEWTDGYTVPFGLFDQDRRPRPSAHTIRQLIQAQTPNDDRPAGTR
jgi:beta-glucosidase